MYVPIFFGLEVYDTLSEGLPIFIENFLTCVCFCHKYNFPIIAQEHYFKDPDYFYEKFDVSGSEYIHHHEHVDQKMVDSIEKYEIKESVTLDIVNKNNNKDEAWINLMNENYSVLENEIIKIVKKIKNYKDIKAFIVFRHNASISSAAKKLKIPVIELEFTTLRRPVYEKAFLYFQFSNKYTTEEFDARYKNFLKETTSSEVDLPVLERKEILDLTLSDYYKKYIKEMDKPEEFDFGVALGLSKDYESKSMNCMLNEQLICETEKLCREDKLLVRMHPSGLTNPDVISDDCVIDNSNNSIEFILKCKRISSVLSNIGFEAMLYGKTSYILGTMPFKKIAVDNLANVDETVVNLKQLNYILFGYFVPYNLVFDKDYLDFRLSNPSEADIYLYNYNYVTNKTQTHRQSLNTRHYYQENQNQIATLSDNIINLEKHVEELNDIIQSKDKQINDIYSSKSWKITAPLRKLISMFRRI